METICISLTEMPFVYILLSKNKRKSIKERVAFATLRAIPPAHERRDYAIRHSAAAQAA